MSSTAILTLCSARRSLNPNRCIVFITPIKLIGAMNTMHRLWDKVKPAEHKALIKDKPLNALFKDAGEKIGAGHSRDALRLCLYVAVARLRDEGTIQLLKENK